MERKNKRKYKLKDITHPITKGVVNIILQELKYLDIYIYHVSKFDSVYLKFKSCPFIGSIRIADHKSVGFTQKYRYKWNLFMEGGEDKEEIDCRVLRRYYTLNNLFNMIDDLKREAQL